MLSNRLQNFGNNSKQSKAEQAKNEAPTSQTLTDGNTMGNFNPHLYQSETISEIELLQHTFGHGQVERLEQLLNNVYSHANQSMQSGELISKGSKNIQNLNELTQSSQRAVAKIAQLRKSIHQKFMGYLLLKSKQTAKKSIIKSNIKKCRDAILTLKTLRDKNFNSEQQIMEFKYRLQTSGLILAPQLIQKCLINLVYRILINRKVKLTVTNIGNLKMVFDCFLDNFAIMKVIWKEYFVEDLVQNNLYAKFKIFIILKTYIDDGEHGNVLRTLFQQRVREYINTSLNKISSVEHNKILSLIQCDENFKQIWHKLAQQQIQQLLSKVYQMSESMERRKAEINQLLKQIVLNRNKNVGDRSKFKINGKKLQCLLQSELYPSIEEINQLLVSVEERLGFFKLCGLHMQIPTAMDILFFIAFQYMKMLLYPLKQVNIQINLILHRDKKQKHYHNYRFVHRSLKIWQKIFSQFQKRSLQINQQTKNALKQLKNVKQIQKSKENSKKANRLTNLLKQYNDELEQNKSIGEFYISYNNYLGDRYLYTVNKLMVGLRDQKQSCFGQIIFKSPKKMHPSFAIEDFANLWIQLVSDKLSDHLLYQVQPANILKNIQFFQQQILDHLENDHKLQNQLNKLEKEVQNLVHSQKKAKGKLSQAKIQEIHLKILELNLRTRNYQRLMRISKIIKVDEEVRQMNEDIYRQIFKKKIK